MKKLKARQIEYFIKSRFGGKLQPMGESASYNQRGPSSSDLGLESLGTWTAGGQVAAGESQPRFRSEPGPGVAALCRALWLLELLLVFSNFFKFIYLYLAVLGLCCCKQAFPSCSNQGSLSCFRAQAVGVRAQ